MGIEDKQVESIIEAHSETVNGLKSERDKYKEQAAKVPDLQRQLEEAQAASGNTDEWEQKYNEEHQAFEDFKTQVASEKADAEKAQAYRGMLATAGIDVKRIDAIMRVTDLSNVEMEDGKLKDADKLEEAAKKEWSDFVVHVGRKQEPPATPPKPSAAVEGGDPDVARRMQERYERIHGKIESRE